MYLFIQDKTPPTLKINIRTEKSRLSLVMSQTSMLSDYFLKKIYFIFDKSTQDRLLQFPISQKVRKIKKMCPFSGQNQTCSPEGFPKSRALNIIQYYSDKDIFQFPAKPMFEVQTVSRKIYKKKADI